MIISSLGMTMVDQHLGHAPSSAAAYLFLAVAGTGALMLGSATDALRRSSEQVAEQNVYLGAVNRRLDQLAQQLRGPLAATCRRMKTSAGIWPPSCMTNWVRTSPPSRLT